MSDELNLEYQNTIDWRPSGMPTDEGTGSLIGYVNGQRAFHIANYQEGKYFAYFMPKGWINFGNNIFEDPCERAPFWKSQDEAKEKCLAHLNAFGLKPNANCRLKG